MRRFYFSLVCLSVFFIAGFQLKAQQPYETAEMEKAAKNFFFEYFKDDNGRAFNYLDILVGEPHAKMLGGEIVYRAPYYILMDVTRPVYVITYDEELGTASLDFGKSFKYYNEKPLDLLASLLNSIKILPEGKRIRAEGVITFVHENGQWKVEDFYNFWVEVKNKEQLPIDYYARWKEAMILAMEEGQYKEPDIPEIDFKVNYYSKKYIPVFDGAVMAGMIAVKEKDCLDCRNDNLKDIERVWLNILEDCKRFSPSDENEYSVSPNAENFVLYVTDIQYDFNGVDEKAGNKGYTCTIDYKIIKEGDYSRPYKAIIKDSITGSVTSKLYPTTYTKEKAFLGALRKLKNKLQKSIYRFHPLGLMAEKIETDKKGRPVYIVAPKPDQIFEKKKRIKFYVVNNKDFKPLNNKIPENHIIGKGVYERKKYPDQVKVKVQGRKMREILQTFGESPGRILLISLPK